MIDVMGGKVVLARKGEREKYKPISLFSEIVDCDEVDDVVKKVAPKYLYVADLDRIESRGDNIEVIEDLCKYVQELIADCGFKAGESLNFNFVPVLGSETFDLTKIPNQKIYVSLDFKDKFLDASGKFKSFEDAVEFLNSFEIEAIVVLSLKNVGTFFANFELAERVLEISDHPVMLGGGIAGIEDLERAKEIGLSGVLVATAVHKKKIPVEIVRKGKY